MRIEDDGSTLGVREISDVIHDIELLYLQDNTPLHLYRKFIDQFYI